jgi:hypothetical protein
LDLNEKPFQIACFVEESDYELCEKNDTKDDDEEEERNEKVIEDIFQRSKQFTLKER